MKTLIIAAACIAATFTATAQDQARQRIFKPFQFHVGFGGTAYTNQWGLTLVNLAPYFRVTDRFAVGLNWEKSLLFRDHRFDGLKDREALMATSYTLTGRYYTSYRGFRPFIGLGGGLTNLREIFIDDGEETTHATKEPVLAISPEMGFETWHFYLSVVYHHLPNTTLIRQIAAEPPTTYEMTNQYFAMRMGFFFGGGRYKK